MCIRDSETIELLNDLTIREKIILLPLAILIIFFGIFPSPVLDLISESSNNLVNILDLQLISNNALGVK